MKSDNHNTKIFQLSRFWRDDRLLRRAFAADFADFRGIPKKNSREFVLSAAMILLFPLKTVEPIFLRVSLVTLCGKKSFLA